MTNRFLIIIGLCVLGIFAASLDFNNKEAAVRLYLQHIEGHINEPFRSIEEDFGPPDYQAESGVVWTYFVRERAKDGGEVITGYRQFGRWEDEIGCYNERNFTSDENAISLYQQVLKYMEEEGRHMGQVSIEEPLPDFSENHRLSRRMDNMWEVDASFLASNSNITLFVYDHQKRGCHMELLDEAKRVEGKLGL